MFIIIVQGKVNIMSFIADITSIGVAIFSVGFAIWVVMQLFSK